MFGKGSNDFGMFIIVIPSEELYELMDLKDDMFISFEVMSKEEERWSSYKKKKDKDFIQNISSFMFSLAPENKIDIDDFIAKTNEATLKMFKTSNEFSSSLGISFFENLERYEDCAYLVKIKDKIVANEEFKTK